MPSNKKRAKKKANIPHYVFPYARFHGKHYPLVPITLKRGKRRVNTFALLDSGATISVFRPEISKALGLPRKNRNGMRLRTADGGVDILLSTIGIQIENTRFNARIGFSDKYAAHFNLIGREGFFRRFSICFNEAAKTVIMVPLSRLRN